MRENIRKMRRRRRRRQKLRKLILGKQFTGRKSSLC